MTTVAPERAAPNAIGSTLGLLGDEWTLLIVRYAFAGVRRFGTWKAQLGISDAVLSSRLTALVDAGLLRREPYCTRPARFEYHLDVPGQHLWPVLVSIWSWEQHHVEGGRERLPTMVHDSCGSSFAPQLRCRHCQAAASVDDVDIALGPSGSFARSMPVGANRRRGPARTAHPAPGLFPETMALIGNRWSSSLLGAAFLGATRFTDFEQMLGAPPTVVSQRLRSFVALGVLERRILGTRPDRATYHLTVKGRAFFPVVATMLAWGERWWPAPDGPAVLAVHDACGAPFVPELACAVCDVRLTASAVRVVPSDVEDPVAPPR